MVRQVMRGHGCHEKFPAGRKMQHMSAPRRSVKVKDALT
jgi:hypothetical protein